MNVRAMRYIVQQDTITTNHFKSNKYCVALDMNFDYFILLMSLVTNSEGDSYKEYYVFDDKFKTKFDAKYFIEKMMIDGLPKQEKWRFISVNWLFPQLAINNWETVAECSGQCERLLKDDIITHKSIAGRWLEDADDFLAKIIQHRIVKAKGMQKVFDNGFDL